MKLEDKTLSYTAVVTFFNTTANKKLNKQGIKNEILNTKSRCTHTAH